MPSRIKCPICNGCTEWVFHTHLKFVRCAFCNQTYRLLPGLKLEIVEENVIQDMVTITKKEYEDLLKSSAFLDELECAGVDNWEGYSIAWDNYKKSEESFKLPL